MLVTPLRIYNADPMIQLLNELMSDDGKEHEPYQKAGIYLGSNWNFEHSFNISETYPVHLEHTDSDKWFGAYGVCDNFQQVLDACPMLETSDRKFCISMVELIAKNQSEAGGWRWHKWGEYIGTQDPQCEYLYDEPVIEKIYTYHVYEIF